MRRSSTPNERQIILPKRTEGEFWEEGEQQADFLIETFLGEDRSQRVLDYGCGVGRVSIPLRERGYHVEGYDPSEGMRQTARENGLLVHDSPPVGEFDRVFSLMVVQHIPTVKRKMTSLLAMVDVLRDGGELFVQFPLLGSSVYPERKPHVYAFTPGEVETIAILLGLEPHSVSRGNLVNYSARAVGENELFLRGVASLGE